MKKLFFYTLALIFLIIPCNYAYSKTQTVAKPSFNAGEVSPSVYGRIDLEKYPNAVKTMTNFLPTPQGGAVRRPGFRYIASTKTASREARLVPFTFSTTQAYIIELGHQYARFYMNGGQIWVEDSNTKLLLHMEGEDAGVTFTDSGATGHTVTANDEAQTDTDRYHLGSSSVLFDGEGTDSLTISDHADFDFAAAEFTIDAWIYVDSTSDLVHPIYEQNKDADEYFRFRVHVSSGALSVTFISYNAGDLVSLNAVAEASYSPGWHHVAVIRGWNSTTNAFAITWDGAVIDTDTVAHTMATLTADVTIGQTPGAIFIGSIDELRASKSVARWIANFNPPMLEYPFLDQSGTVYEIATTYTETDLDDLKFAQSADTLYVVHPDYVVRQITRTDHDAWSIANTSFTAAPADWGAAGCNNGHPAAISFHQDRLVFAACPGLPDRLWFSKTSDYTNMTTGSADDDALVINLLSGRIDAIRWLSSKRKLLAGTIGGEWWIGGGGEMGVITPTSKQALQDTTYGSIDLQPITIDNTLIYVQEPGHKVREISYNWSEDSYGGNDLTVLSEHLLKSNTVTEWAVQKTPYTTVWMVRDDGDLLALTYMKEHNVVAWSTHTTTGDFESVASIPGPLEDEIWVIVRRDIDGSSVRYVERLDPFFNSTSLADAFFVDSGLSYAGAGVTTLSGLNHLEGEAVQVLADGVVITGKTVSGNAITLSSSATEVHIGIGYNSDLETLGVEIANPNQLSANKRKDITSITLRLEDSAGGDYGKDSSNLYTIIPSTSLYNGIKENLTFKMGPSLEATVFIRQDEPLPFRINALLMEVEVSY